MRTLRNFSTIAGVAFIGISPFYFYGALSVQIIQDLNYNPASHGYGATAFYLFAAVFAAMLGRVSDNTNPIATIRVSLTITLISNLGIAFSNSLITMGIFLGLGGIGNALSTPGIARFVQQSIKYNRQGLAYGVKQSATGISTLIGGAAIPFVADPGQWRFVFLTGAVFCLGLIILVGEFQSKARLITSVITHIKTQKNVTKKAVIYSNQVKLIGIGFGVGAAVGAGLISYLALSNFEAGITGKQAGLVLVYSSIGSIVTRLVILILMDLTSWDAIRVCALMMTIGAVGIFGLATMNGDLVLVSSVISYSMGWGWVGLIGYKLLRISDTNLGTNTGFIQSAAAIGSLTGPLMLSVVYNFGGFILIWITSGLALILAMALLLFSEKFNQVI